MKSVLLGICCFVAILTVAQPVSTCVFAPANTGSSLRFKYTETFSAKDSFVFTTTYYVFDNNNLPFKAITATNNTQLKSVTLTLRELKTGTEEETYNIPYNQFSGLIISSQSDSVAQLTKPYNYRYLICFTNAQKTEVRVSYLSVLDKYSILFSIITDSALSVNREFLKQSAYYKQFLIDQQRKKAEQEAREKLIDSLVNVRLNEVYAQTKNTPTEPKSSPPTLALAGNERPKDDLLELVLGAARAYRKRWVNDSIEVVKIEKEILSRLDKLVFNPMKGHYDDDKKGGVFYGDNAVAREGNGILVQNGARVYSGTFVRGQFVSGIVHLKNKDGSVYLGNYAYAQPKGLGKWTFPSGVTLLGVFDAKMLESGTVRMVDTEQTHYRGEIVKDRKNGFGILTTKEGDSYIGIFENDVMKDGYIFQTDDVGLKGYFVVKHNVKTAISQEEWLEYSKQFSAY